MVLVALVALVHLRNRRMHKHWWLRKCRRTILLRGLKVQRLMLRVLLRLMVMHNLLMLVMLRMKLLLLLRLLRLLWLLWWLLWQRRPRFHKKRNFFFCLNEVDAELFCFLLKNLKLLQSSKIFCSIKSNCTLNAASTSTLGAGGRALSEANKEDWGAE